MTTSDRLYVWVWLPQTQEPVVAGVLARSVARLGHEDVLTFTYARSYRERTAAISLFSPELPLHAGLFDPTRPGETLGVGVITLGGPVVVPPPRTPLALHGCLRDGAPDAWGRRVINLRVGGTPETEMTEMTYLAASGSDRIGGLDFQASPTDYVARGGTATLDQLLHVAELVEAGQPLPEDRVAAASHGTSIGGARPKAPAGRCRSSPDRKVQLDDRCETGGEGRGNSHAPRGPRRHHGGSGRAPHGDGQGRSHRRALRPGRR